MHFRRLIRALAVAASMGLVLAACAAPGLQRAGAQLDEIGGITGTPTDGRPGVDYTTSVITAVYSRTVLPQGILALSPPAPGQRAGEQPNAILRKNNEYEALTDAIAGRCGLRIRSQVYVGGCNFAAFDVPPGTDPAQALARLRAEFAGSLRAAGFAALARGGMMPNDPDFVMSNPLGSTPQWGQKRIGCEAAWDISTGDPGFMVAVVDTGVYYAHEELAGQVLVPDEAFPGEQLDLINHDNTVEDEDGHGTAIAGIIAAKTNNNRTLAGIAFNCRILPVKIAATTDFGNMSDIATGIMLAATLGARVISCSWYGGRNAEMETAVDELVNQGKLLVVCAGNKSSTTSSYPAGYPGCMSVGASATDDACTWFSNHGADVDIAAPGGGDTSSERLKYCGTGNPSVYVTAWGTSFSTPMVAAGAALLWSYDPSLTLEQVRDYLEQNGPVSPDFAAGHPVHRLDLAAVLQEALPGVRVEGTVVDNTGAELSGVALTLETLGSVQHSDSAGAFRFANVPAGDYVLSPSLSGYFFLPSGMDISVGANDISGLTFTAWPDTYPLLGTISVQNGDIVGAAVGRDVLSITATSLQNTASVRYTLDLAPVGHVDAYDLSITSTDAAGGFPADFGVAAVDLRNQAARLTAVPINDVAQEGPVLAADVDIFNLLGDANADGVVDLLDLEAFPAKAGLTRADPGYSVFFDSDQDGVITEADAAAVGYFFGASSM